MSLRYEELSDADLDLAVRAAFPEPPTQQQMSEPEVEEILSRVLSSQTEASTSSTNVVGIATSKRSVERRRRFPVAFAAALGMLLASAVGATGYFAVQAIQDSDEASPPSGSASSTSSSSSVVEPPPASSPPVVPLSIPDACSNSFDAACGPLQWQGQPPPNARLEASIQVSASGSLLGRPLVTIQFQGSDEGGVLSWELVQISERNRWITNSQNGWTVERGCATAAAAPFGTWTREAAAEANRQGRIADPGLQTLTYSLGSTGWEPKTVLDVPVGHNELRVQLTSHTCGPFDAWFGSTATHLLTFDVDEAGAISNYTDSIVSAN